MEERTEEMDEGTEEMEEHIEEDAEFPPDILTNGIIDTIPKERREKRFKERVENT